MKRFIPSSAVGLLVVFLLAGAADALTLSISPNPAETSQQVHMNISTLLIPASVGGIVCEVRIDFGDGNQGVAGVCGSTNCNLSVVHSYSRAGSYTVTAWVNTYRCNAYPDPIPGRDSRTLLVRCKSLSAAFPSLLPSGKVNEPYVYRLRAVGGQPSYHFSVVGGSLPPGLALDPSGTIRGTPQKAGRYSAIVAVSDSCSMGAQTVKKRIEIEIQGVPPTTVTQSACPDLLFATGQDLPNGMVNRPYSARLAVKGGTPPVRYAVSAGALPPGLSLSSAGLLSGTPRRSGIYRFTASVTDSCPDGPKTASRAFRLEVLDEVKPPPRVTAHRLNAAMSPKHVTVPRGLPATVSFTYTFSGDREVTQRLSSSSGLFSAMGRPIGTVPSRLNVDVRNGTGRVSERVSIPVAVLKRAERLGTTRFQYSRSFTGGMYDLTVSSDIVITTEAAAPFTISRLQLYFENNRAEITISKGQKPPKVYAEIRYLGTGLLKGYWEVDGRPLANVFKHITYGRSITLELPHTSVLPTFEPGVHRIRFVITEPSFAAELPEAVYFITAETYRVKGIELVSPANDAKLTMSGLEFSWKEVGTNTFAYLIEFRQDQEAGKPLFSAYVKGSRYRVPDQIAVRYFSEAGRLYWQVKGFDQEGQLIGRSETRQFEIEGKNVFVPGQVMLTWNSSSDVDVGAMEKRLGIRLLYKFELESIGVVCGVFSTNGQDVVEVVKKASGLSQVEHASPNYIFQLYTDPMVKRQVIYDLLDRSALRSLGQGRKPVVAVIDTGVDVTHPDLQGAVIVKKNFVHGDSYRPEIHGTAVSGIIAARVNGLGTEGIAPMSRLMALRACRQIRNGQAQGQCFSDSIARALDYSVSKGAKVVNMSLGSFADDEIVSAIIRQGSKKGLIFVAPVGNRGNTDQLPFPARLEEVVSVGGVGEDGSCFPNRGLCTKADVVAPCQNIFTTVPKGYNFMTGTSMASALVAGLLALDVKAPAASKEGPRPVKLCRWLSQSLERKICSEERSDRAGKGR